MAEKSASLQDQFLNAVRRAKAPVVIYLVKGVKLQGVVTGYDAFSILLRREGGSQLIYKHAISTILPLRPVEGLPSASAKPPRGRSTLQDAFLAASELEQPDMSIFLMSGIMLQGKVTGFGQFALLLERGGQVQLVYKHAVSTLQSAVPLHLDGAMEAEAV